MGVKKAKQVESMRIYRVEDDFYLPACFFGERKLVRKKGEIFLAPPREPQYSWKVHIKEIDFIDVWELKRAGKWTINN